MNTSTSSRRGLLDKLTQFLEDEDTLPPEQEQETEEEHKPAQLNPVWYYWIFAASGFAGLIYESIWARYLKLFLGHAAYAQALVLAIFLLGLALGAAWCARLSHRLERPLLGYVVIEIFVALTAVYFHDIFTWAQSWAIDSVLPGIASDNAAELFKWTLAALLILPQSILLGATFPLMSAGLLRLWPEKRGHIVAMLYFSNSLGAVFGVLASGYLLIPLTGLPITITIAGIINTGAAAAVWTLGHLFNDTGAPLPPANTSTGDADAPKRLKRLVLAVAFGTGMASFVYEIIWVRMLSLLMGASTHTFEVMLAAFILGLACGSLIIRKRAHSGDNLLATLGTVQVLMGIMALWSLACFPLFYEILRSVLGTIPRTDAGYWGYNAMQLGLAMLMMLPSTLCAGMTLPLLTRTLMDNGGESAIGKVYAANTLGAIAGVVLAMHLLLPLVGMHLSILIAAAVDIGIGLVLLALVLRRRLPLATALGSGALVLAAAFGSINVQIASAGVFRSPNQKLPEVVFYQDGKTASISVTESTTNHSSYTTRSLRTNGKTDAAVISGGTAKEDGHTADDTTMVMLGLLPLLYNPDLEVVMNIGFGSGTTSYTLLRSPTVQRLDNVEIEPAIIAGARQLGSRIAPVFDDPRNIVIYNDAKSVLARAKQRYDAIISEPSNPWVSGVSNLFTKEFYARVRSTLKEDGLFVQWLPLYESNPQAVASVVAALADVFDDFHVYSNATDNLLFIASAEGKLPPPSDAALAMPALRDYVSNHNFSGIADLRTLFLGDKAMLLPYFQSFQVGANSDYSPHLEHFALRAFFDRTTYGFARTIRIPIPVIEFFGHAPRGGDVKPTRHSNIMNHAAEAQTDYANRLSPQGVLQQKLAAIAGHTCPQLAQHNDSIAVIMQAVSDITGSLMPMLNKSQMAEIWQLLQQNDCVQTLLGSDDTIAGNYIQFWRAVALRDSATMIQTTDVLLPHAELGSESGQILLLGAMAAHYQSGNYQRVVLLMLEFPRVYPDTFHAARMFAASAAEKI